MSTSDMLQAPRNCILYRVSQVPARVSPRSIARCVAGQFLAHPQLLLSNGHDPWASSTSGSLVAERAGGRGELAQAVSLQIRRTRLRAGQDLSMSLFGSAKNPPTFALPLWGVMMKLNAAVFL